MGLFSARTDGQVPRLDFELGHGCDHACGHCYNVWNASPGDPQAGYPRGHLSTPELLAMMHKSITESGARHVTLTGGEPLLRKDALDIIDQLSTWVPSIQLITNGSHVDEAVAARLARARVRSVQLTLLAGDRALHDRLKGATCFDDTLRAAAHLAAARVPVQICYVATHENEGQLPAVLELAFAVGARGISYNRMSATGWAVHELDRLVPEIESVEKDVVALDAFATRTGISVATAMPLPPCLIRMERYPHVQTGFCSVGTASPNVTIDPLGNVRSCNLSSHILGNIREKSWGRIYPGTYVKTFHDTLPAMCRGCRWEKSCRGGCKESAFATYGDRGVPEPFIARALGELPTRAQRLRVLA